jgi:acetyl-CoA carboxylase biotin carboxyl carrier protein
MPLSDDDVREILRIIDSSELAELQIETEGFSLHVVRGPTADAAAPAASPPQRLDGDPSPPATTETQNHLLTIPSPMLGTFYRAEAPGKPPFVEVGSPVDADTIVCIIEVMKMMNSVPAGVSGTIAEIVPENAELVEYGQPLFRVQPA